MLLTRLKLIIREWKRNKLFSITAILSLTIGFVCCNLLTSFVINEWKISKGSPDCDKIYILKTDNPMTLKTTKEKSSWILKQIPPLFKEKYPEINTFCRCQTSDDGFEYEEYKSHNLTFLHTDNNINDFFNIPVIAGNLHKTLSSPGEAAITSSLAKKVFGSTNVLGKTFTLISEKGNSPQKITSVIDDSYTSSFLTFDILLPLNEATYHGGVSFFKLKNSQASVSLIEKIDKDIEKLPRLTPECNYYLQSLTDFYFDKTETQTNWKFLLKRDRLFMYIGIISAIAILFIACFNFINLYLVRLFKSNTNNSIHKILGASTRELQIRFLLESFSASIIAFISSFIIILATLPAFNKLFKAHLSFSFLLDKTVLIFYLILIIIFTFIPVIYLALKFNRKGYEGIINKSTEKQKTLFSNTMISIQFGFSILLIISAFLYTKQLHFISETANINPNLIQLYGEGISNDNIKVYKNEVNNLSCVEVSTISPTSFLNAFTALGDDGIPILLYRGDSDFLKVHNLTLTAGSGFHTDSENSTNQAIVNERLINKYKIDNPIGKTVSFLGEEITIIGVVKDFYTELFTVKVKPTIIRPYNVKEKYFCQFLQIKLKNGNKQAAIGKLKTLWTTTFPNKTFTYSFLMDDFKDLHKDYKQLADMIAIFTIISILLSIFGLFAIAWYSVERRTKEIGIRKVNGARISEILITINKDFLKLIIIAFICACPIAYIIMTKWLQHFAYKTNISWWIFVASGLCTSCIALLTISWQSFRAATKNPVEALKDE